MPRFWHHFLPKSSPAHHRNLQEGLFQIASQTCSLLVQVNNTNNITFGDNATNINCNNIHNGLAAGVPLDVSSAIARASGSSEEDQEQLLVLIPPTGKTRYKPTGNLRKPTLSPVLEGSILRTELLHNGYAASDPHDRNQPNTRGWRRGENLCRPSCVPVIILFFLIVLVVLLPLLENATESALQQLNFPNQSNTTNATCSVSLVESIPIGMQYPNGTTPHPSTHQSWIDLIDSAQYSIEIASFYWTLRQTDVYPDPSSKEGQEVFDAILKAGTERGITVKIAQNAPSREQPNTDTELLIKRKAAEVRSLNFAQLVGDGVLHTKLWIIDRKHFYLGSANMDWRALTQVKEMGVLGMNCSCLAEDVGKIFDVYWAMGQKGATVPDNWPAKYETNINIENPLVVELNGENFETYLSSSPPPFSPNGRSEDINAIVNVIQTAEKFIYIAVMDYFPLMIYSPKVKYWPVIDDALREAAIDHRVEVRLLVSWWNHSRSSEDYFLKSLVEVSDSYPKVSIAVRRFIVPSTPEQQKIPFGRVNHNKYMVTDNTAYIGTSNWSGDYFTNTAGIGFVAHDPVYNRNSTVQTLRSQLQAVFDRDWNSNYSKPMNFNKL